MTDIVVRTADAEDIGAIRRALYLAATWDIAPPGPPMEAAMTHPDLVRYHAGWGREGDLAVVALDGASAVGACWARRYLADDHGHGFVDEETPELGIGVEPGSRGGGVGRRMMEALHSLARADGRSQVSLSVNADNPSRHLYLNLGYRDVGRDPNCYVMVLELS